MSGVPKSSGEHLARGRVLKVDPAIGDVRRRRSLRDSGTEQREAYKVLEDGSGPHMLGRAQVRRHRSLCAPFLTTSPSHFRHAGPCGRVHPPVTTATWTARWLDMRCSLK